MKNFWKVVNEVIEESDIILEVLDARFVDDTRNKEIEDKVEEKGKKLIYVINKCDLVLKEKLEEKKKELSPSVFVSSTKRYGITLLLHEILRYADNKKERVIIGVLGYPNTGKSSVINALKGRSSASTSPVGGHTKGRQLIKVTNKIYLMDAPGVYPYMEKDETKHALVASVDYTKVRDPEAVAFKLLESFRKEITDYYGVEANDDEGVLEEIALKLKMLRKGSEPDTERAARLILRDWQQGKLQVQNI